MGRRRRGGKLQNASKDDESSSSSGEDMERKAMNIIEKLSKKYLKSSLNESKKNEEGKVVEAAYDGDSEHSSSPATTVTSSDVNLLSPVYDFDASDNDEMSLKLELSPCKPPSKKTKFNKHDKLSPNMCSESDRPMKKSTRKISPKSDSENEGVKKRMKKSKVVGVKPKLSKTQKMLQSITTNTSQEEKTMKPNKKTQNKGKVKASKPVAAPKHVPEICAPPKRKLNEDLNTKPTNEHQSMEISVQSSASDSGLFLSPPPRKLSKLTATPGLKGEKLQLGTLQTSTPSVAPRKTSDDSCFGFDSIETPIAMPSPVRNYSTPLSDYGSMGSSKGSQLMSSVGASPNLKSRPQSSQGSIDPAGYSESLENCGLTGKELIKSPVHQAKRLSKKKVKEAREKREVWEDKMAAEFEDIENFTLSIEGI
ncbi:unnamed protein product [Owenia fusiformis]|uniref:Uncharacterized protein n=1 Tax=Owenia fusiformis TaxID=6347 RepID=A0A8J1U1N2_OWEFU|nr:unnamed protein product [Owenia fusiformis]